MWLRQTKNGEGRGLLEHNRKAALSSLKPHSASSNALVFDLNGDYVHHTFKKACDDPGIVDFRFHDLRHTAASWLRMTGQTFTASQPCGHKDLRMTARYSHLSPAFLSEAASSTAFSDSPLPQRYLSENYSRPIPAQLLKNKIVPLTGLEPVVSALRGRRVNHLHYSGKLRALGGYSRCLHE